MEALCSDWLRGFPSPEGRETHFQVCLADTDGACLLTAAESGSQERYKLLALQVPPEDITPVAVAIFWVFFFGQIFSDLVFSDRFSENLQQIF